MLTFKKFILTERYDFPISTNKDIDKFNSKKVDKKALKNLLKLLKKSKTPVPVPLVGGTGSHEGKISVRLTGAVDKKGKSIRRTAMKAVIQKIVDKWKKATKNKIKNVRVGDGTIRGRGDEPVGKKKMFSKGDTAEGVFATMLFMKFADKPMTEKALNKILYRIKLNKEIKATTTTHKKVQDIIKLSINLAPQPFADLTNPEFEALRNGMFLSANAYTKSKNIEKYEKYFKSNGILDEIRIVADGLGNQKETKTDIYVEVKRFLNGSPVIRKLNLSVKYDKAPQFGQVSGSKFSNFVELWETFGYDISPLEGKFEKLIAKGDVTKAINLVYKTALSFFNKDFSTKTEDMSSITKLFKGIIHHATLGENIEMVHLNKGTFKSYTFKQTKAKLISLAKAHKFTAELFTSKPREGSVPLPRIKIFMDGEPFLQIRSKADMRSNGSFYARNYIEKEKAFSSIFSKQYT